MQRQEKLQMKRAQQERQRDLFESNEPPIRLPLDQVKSLVEMVRALLIEISVTSKVKEPGDDEDHI
jgi:hypothetical protein